jgi:hypothetical protein
MPRKMRVEYPGAMYHVMSRGDQRDDIFLDDVDRHEFIKTLAEACQKTDWWVHAFCLMKNHSCDYVHLNPIRAKLLAGEDRLLSYPWSSFPWYLAAPQHRPAWLRVDRLLGEHRRVRP